MTEKQQLDALTMDLENLKELNARLVTENNILSEKVKHSAHQEKTHKVRVCSNKHKHSPLL